MKDFSPTHPSKYGELNTPSICVSDSQEVWEKGLNQEPLYIYTAISYRAVSNVSGLQAVYCHIQTSRECK